MSEKKTKKTKEVEKFRDIPVDEIAKSLAKGEGRFDDSFVAAFAGRYIELMPEDSKGNKE